MVWVRIVWRPIIVLTLQHKANIWRSCSLTAKFNRRSLINISPSHFLQNGRSFSFYFLRSTRISLTYLINSRVNSQRLSISVRRKLKLSHLIRLVLLFLFTLDGVPINLLKQWLVFGASLVPTHAKLVESLCSCVELICTILITITAHCLQAALLGNVLAAAHYWHTVTQIHQNVSKLLNHEHVEFARWALEILFHLVEDADVHR